MKFDRESANGKYDIIDCQQPISKDAEIARLTDLLSKTYEDARKREDKLKERVKELENHILNGPWHKHITAWRTQAESLARENAELRGRVKELEADMISAAPPYYRKWQEAQEKIGKVREWADQFVLSSPFRKDLVELREQILKGE